MMRTLYLERPAFWTEPRDPEAWLRALDVLVSAAADALADGPRAIWRRVLDGTVSRRAAHGLFGATPGRGGARLHGVGLLAPSDGRFWMVTGEGRKLIADWKRKPAHALEEYAGFLVRESPWLRLLLGRLLAGDWELRNWPRVRAGRRGLVAGTSLILHRHPAPADWFAGAERAAAGPWLARTGCATLAIARNVLARARGQDDLSWAPLTAPVHLLESVGWLRVDGALSLPRWARADLGVSPGAARLLADISSRRADVRGFVPPEATLRELLTATAQVTPAAHDFARWMDELVRTAVATGAIEVLATEPGQSRHGRGLFGDPARQLVRWVIHDEFDALFLRAWAVLDPGAPAASDRGPDGDSI